MKRKGNPMRKSITLIFVSLALMACANGQYPASAANGPNILIMGDDSDKSSIPRSNRAFTRVLDALANEFIDSDYKVYDETAITLDNFKQGRVRRSDAEIIDICKSVGSTKIDIAVIFAIYPLPKKLNFVTKVGTRVEGRLLNCRNGRRLGNFEIEGATRNVPSDCKGDCIIEKVGKHAKEIAQDLGSVLMERLQRYAGPSTMSNGNDPKNKLNAEYNIIFNGFKKDAIHDIEEMLLSFKGYVGHQTLSSSRKTIEYKYETKRSSLALIRSIERILEHLDLKALVQFSGDTIKVSSTRMNQ
jgi:hypothetical protein